MTEGRVHLLPDSLVDKIAAGEVVERPASVVKELVENSLDARASFVDVSVQQGGKTSISVRDDGIGMTPEELRLAVQRHATSKINSIEDLDIISTYGFRGEALPSIAAVSRFSIASRAREMDLAYRIEIENSSIKSDGYEPSSVGTHVLVRDLFHNVPARLKFLKKDSTELAHVQDTVVRLAMVRPDVRFRLVTDGRTALELPRHGDRLTRARAILKRRGGDSLTSFERTDGDYGVELILAPPHVNISDTSGVYLFVNGRVVRDRFLLGTLVAGYGGMLERRRYPVAVLFLKVPEGALDVNVHPQKLEVRFREERKVAALVRSSVAQALAAAPWAPGGVRGSGAKEQDGSSGTRYVLKSTAEQTDEATGDRRASILAAMRRSAPPAGRRESGIRMSGSAFSRDASGLATASAPSSVRKPLYRDGSLGLSSGMPSHGDATSGESVTVPVGRIPDVRYLGQFHGLYLLFETPQGLMVLDQHAAHERIRYVTIFRQMQERQVLQQRLLFPERVNLSPAEMSFLAENTVDWPSLGFDAEPFGTDELMVRATPAILQGSDVTELVHDVIGTLMTGGTGLDAETMDHLAATMACHGAVRAGDSLSRDDALALLARLQEVEAGGHCPHGRPVSFVMTLHDIEKRFHRT